MILSPCRNVVLGAAPSEDRQFNIQERTLLDSSSGTRVTDITSAGAATEPSVVLFDEPLGSLDANLRKAMQVELKRMHRELGRTFVYVTHDQDEALTMSDRIAVMQNSRLLQLGSPEDVYLRPNSAAVARFIGAANIVSGTIESVDAHGVRVRLGSGGAVYAAASAHGLRPAAVELGRHGQRGRLSVARAQVELLSDQA